MSIGFRICTRPHTAPKDLVDAFAKLPVANVSDSMWRLSAGGPRLRPMHASGGMAGVALNARARQFVAPGALQHQLAVGIVGADAADEQRRHAQRGQRACDVERRATRHRAVVEVVDQGFAQHGDGRGGHENILSNIMCLVNN